MHLIRPRGGRSHHPSNKETQKGDSYEIQCKNRYHTRSDAGDAGCPADRSLALQRHHCSLVHDSKNNPYTIYPQWRLSIPFLQKPFCNIGSNEWSNGFYWVDSNNQCWKAIEVTEAAMLGNDLFIIRDSGNYTRVILPSGLLAVDIGRLIGEKIVDLINAIKTQQPLDAFFKTIGIPGVSVSDRQAEPRDIAQLY